MPMITTKFKNYFQIDQKRTLSGPIRPFNLKKNTQCFSIFFKKKAEILNQLRKNRQIKNERKIKVKEKKQKIAVFK